MNDLRSLRRAAAARLAEAGVPSPQVDADLLLAHVLGIDRGRLIAAPDPTPAQAAEYERLVARRIERVPLQHLTGTAPFRHLELRVGPGVFVPRPETEVLVDLALAEPFDTAIDLCAGSGAIALALALEAAPARVQAVELDEAALAWTRRNLADHREHLAAAGSELELLAADVCGEPGLWTGVDLVVSNPPYIPDAMVPRDPEVARHDPPLALFGGPDGMVVVHRVAAHAARVLRPGGRVLVEHAEQQGEAVGALLAAAGLVDVRTWPDLTGRPRVTGAVQD